ncbi:MAG: hypothetical protein ABIQ88_17315 [Chitinophagaceae bacterium]
MKKLLIAAAMLVISSGIFAQAQPKKEVKDASKMTAVKKEPAKVVPIAKPAPATATTAGPIKKDGTADMRYKTNKETAKPVPAGPTKKDGTADMRYKANKNPKKKN